LSLLGLIFVRILYKESHVEIGWNLANEARLTYLGISAKKEELVLPPTLFFFCEWTNILLRSYLIKDQQTKKNEWKNHSVSGPYQDQDSR
jgi:hypothetical protein